MRTVRIQLIALLVLMANQAIVNQVSAEVVAPQVTVEMAVNNVMTVLKTDKQRLVDDPNFLNTKVEELVLPYMDFVAMSKLVLGKHWRNADKTQRNAFVEQFRQLLVRTYSKSLSGYTDETVAFLPFKAGKTPEKRATVKSEIRRSNGPSIPINYKLRFKESDGWKVYDINVEGISLVTNYRSSFSREVSSKGLNKLISSLQSRNKASAEGKAK